MAHYFFHLRDGTDLLVDLEGRKLDDIVAIETAAIAEARALISHEALEGQIRLAQHIEVADEAGTIVKDVSFAEAVAIHHDRDRRVG